MPNHKVSAACERLKALPGLTFQAYSVLSQNTRLKVTTAQARNFWAKATRSRIQALVCDKNILGIHVLDLTDHKNAIYLPQLHRGQSFSTART